MLIEISLGTPDTKLNKPSDLRNRSRQHTPHRLCRLPLGCASDVGVGIETVKRECQTNTWSGTPSLLYLKYAQVVPNWVSKPKD